MLRASAVSIFTPYSILHTPYFILHILMLSHSRLCKMNSHKCICFFVHSFLSHRSENIVRKTKMEAENICEKFFLFRNAFNEMQCLICYTAFKSPREDVFKRHYEHSHNEYTKLNRVEKYRIFREKRNCVLRKLKLWLSDMEATDDEMNHLENQKKLKVTLSTIISLHIAKHGRPFTDGTFIRNICTDILNKINYKTDVVQSIPLSARTIARRIQEVAHSIEFEILKTVNNCKYFSISLDESTDINDLCQLVICIRSVSSDYVVFESMFSMETLHANVTGKILFDIVNENVFSKLDMSKLIGVCTDGASVMVGKNDGFVGQLIKHGIEMSSLHCIIHQVALASKFLSTFPAMKTAEKIINTIRGGHHSLTHRKFVQFLKNTDAEHYDLKMFTEVRWLSRGDCLSRLYDLRDKVIKFLKIEKLENTEHLIDALQDNSFNLDLAFLTDITNFVNKLNLQLQGKNKTVYNLYNSIFEFKTKLFLLLANIQEENYSSFPKASFFDNITSEQKNEHIDIIETLINNFENRFKDFEELQPLFNLFENPLKCDITKYEFQIQSELIILRSEIEMIDKQHIIEFWKSIDGSFYPQLKAVSYKLLAFYPSTYFCEQIFSDLKFICSKQRNRLTNSPLKSILLIRNCNKKINISELIENIPLP